jgi:uncharacterized protein (DUF58 family)
MRLPIALVLCVPLAGCFSLTGPAPLPEWAMNPQQQVASETQTRPRRAVVQREPRAAEVEVEVADRSGTLVGVPTNVQPAGLAQDGAAPRAAAVQPREPTAFSAEWKAREDAEDEKLRRSMNICRGC